MDFFDFATLVVGACVPVVSWYINALRAKFEAVEKVNSEQSAKLAALELYIAKNHPDNMDFQRLADSVDKVVAMMSELRAEVRGLMARG